MAAQLGYDETAAWRLRFVCPSWVVLLHSYRDNRDFVGKLTLHPLANVAISCEKNVIHRDS